MKNKSALLTLEQAQSNISSFKWERYQRDFEPETPHLKEVYWTIVVRDLLSMSEEDWKTFPDRFYRSFLGTFYRANEMNLRLMNSFSGISGFEWHEKKSKLKSWDERLGKIVSSEVIILRENIRTHYQTGNMHKIETKESISLRQFDHYHKQLAQRVSAFLCNHIRYQGQEPHKRIPEEVPAEIKVEKPIITELQQRADTFVRANATRSIISHIEQYFGSPETLIHDEKRTASYRASTEAPRRVFTAYVKVAGPTQAYNDLVTSRPKCKLLSDQALTDIIMMRYRDQNGDELKRNSVRKVILSIRKKES